MTTLLIRYPAKASVDSGAAQTCPFALVGDGGNLLQQGVSPLGNLSDLVASSRRVVLLLAAADVTLLRVVAPPLSAARLKAALPALVEEQVLGDPADCVLAAGAADADGGRTVAVVQRSWIEVLVKALLAQGAHHISVLPAQLCLPFQPGSVSAALTTGDAGFELILRQSQTMGMGLTLPAQPQAALQTLRAMAGDEPVTLYLAPAQMAQFAPLVATADAGHGVTLMEDHWAHWVAASRSAGLDLAPALGASGANARQWQRWRWPLRIAALALLVNVVGLNVEWLRLKREAAAVSQSMLQTFKAAYPNEPVILDPAAQMRKNISLAKADGGQPAADEFTALSAALGEALGALPRKDIIATLEYRDRALQIKVKPNTVDSGTLAQLRSALAARKLDLSETNPGAWQIRPASGAGGGKS
ncbi:general secretion pathway protein GspL [Duganella sp. BJB488]|uniref:type II secretion system protein GspL n=1 Tax=unclassified Duganella TaxID=2636909 RepID=UPI000E3407C7|nr:MULTISPECIES: type II secretion system protein GspL [unclassified Duganella]RFP24165.1 general secretion pathway protein GspL [Duganella sp. BJB489]RFP26526.1 general secretion pathway protein GspL [Duganella sp. BJB488]RFP34742.1 general secretion pathway protein GspL [Duganella sp. BJB480]